MSMGMDDADARQRAEHRVPRPAPVETGAPMRARTWTIAACYRTPADYDIPRLPEWDVSRPETGGVAFAATEDSDPFIRAASPVRVRR